jgi:hypothetical protein
LRASAANGAPAANCWQFQSIIHANSGATACAAPAAKRF